MSSVTSLHRVARQPSSPASPLNPCWAGLRSERGISTTNRTGLEIEAGLDTNTYPNGIHVLRPSKPLRQGRLTGGSPSAAFQLSSGGGEDPTWARNGEIFYRHGEDVLVVAPRLAGRVEFDAPRKLFSFPLLPGFLFQTFDVTRDGSRILAVSIPEASRPRQLEIVTEWTRELQRLAPGKGP